MREFQMCHLQPSTQARVEQYAAQEGISIDEALEVVVLEVIGSEGLKRALAKLDKDLDRVKPRLALVKPIDVEAVSEGLKRD